MPEYLKLQSLNDSKQLFWQHLAHLRPGIEEIDSRNALGRVIAEDICSNEFLPAFTRSTVDGYAVQAASTHGASDSLPAYLDLVGEVPMGTETTLVIQSGQTALIHTGGMLPPGADAVVMMEQTQTAANDVIEVLKPVTSGENLVLKGEDVKPGEVVIPTGTLVRAAEIGGLLALGILRVKVTKKPRVAILSSGDEVILPEQTPQPGQVRDINSDMLSALVKANGGISQTHPILPDQKDVLQQAIRKAYDDSDLVIVTAGSSASTRDMTSEVLNSMGSPGVLVHGINIKPGKPTILAVCDGKPMIGLPGNPVSALVIAHLIVKPLLERMTGFTHHNLVPVVTADLAVNLPSIAGRDEYFPVRLYRQDDHFIADPIFYKSNLIYSLVRADGLVHIEPDSTGLIAGTIVEVTLF